MISAFGIDHGEVSKALGGPSSKLARQAQGHFRTARKVRADITTGSLSPAKTELKKKPAREFAERARKRAQIAMKYYQKKGQAARVQRRSLA